MIALMILGCFIYLVATEYISAKKSKGEVLLFRRRKLPDLRPKFDEEAITDDRINTETLAKEKTMPEAPANIQKQRQVFHWDSVNYDIKIKGEPRRLLDQVDGWVVPGTLTALMVCYIPPQQETWPTNPFRGLLEPGRPLYLMYSLTVKQWVSSAVKYL